MKKSRFSEAQILGIRRQQDQGQTGRQICREHRIREATFYRWKSKFGGMTLRELERLKHLEDENRRRQQLYAEWSLEPEVLQEGVRKSNYPHGPPPARPSRG